MEASTTLDSAMADQDRNITAVIERERGRLRSFIGRRVSDPGDVDDILQDVFFELVAASRLLQPIEQVGAWLFRVARNRIVDRFRRKSVEPTKIEGSSAIVDEDEPSLEELLPSPDAGPEARYARRLLLEELDAALEELPAAQREVFVAHELEGRSFRELASETGLSINTLLARKRYAVLHLRDRLQAIHMEFNTSEG
jgi:RNA polymerase sigma factor (sigma-70 family)